MSAGLVVWSGTEILYSTGEVGTKKIVRKVNEKRNIKYNIFLLLSEKSSSEFWKDRLSKYSRNIFPTDITFTLDSNSCSLQSGWLNYKITSKFKNDKYYIDENKLDVNGVIKFLNDKGIMSEEDEKKMRLKFIPKDGITYKNWSDIKNKHVKNFVILEYIQKLQKEESLQSSEVEQLRKILNLGFVSCYFNNETVIMNKNKIKNIINLKRNEKGYYIDIKVKMKKPKSSIKKKKKMDSSTYTFTSTNSNEISVVETNFKNFDIINNWIKVVKKITEK